MSTGKRSTRVASPRLVSFPATQAAAPADAGLPGERSGWSVASSCASRYAAALSNVGSSAAAACGSAAGREMVNAAASSGTATTIQDARYRRPLTGRSIEPERGRTRAAGRGEGLGNGAAIVGRGYPRLMSNPATILLVDDEEAVQKLLAYPLERDGYRVVQARDGDEALRQFEEHSVDLVVLDLMLPKLDGLEVCKRLRAVSHVPIIMLTARDDEVDKVLGLELGADDYITKPFSIREFRSRVKAALRRAAAPKHDADGQEAISIDGLVVDPARRAVQMNGEPVELTYVEFELLSTLASKPGRVYSRQALLVALWGDSAYRDPRTIDVHVRHLREKLEPTPSEPQFILTVRGVGYRFRDA